MGGGTGTTFPTSTPTSSSTTSTTSTPGTGSCAGVAAWSSATAVRVYIPSIDSNIFISLISIQYNGGARVTYKWATDLIFVHR
jgi:hypothetical protein